MDLKYSQIAQASRFSNEKIVNLIKYKLAESENAAVALVFDDKLIVLDEDKDQFYSVDYKIEDRALHLENWEKIDLLADNDSRLETVSEAFFDPYNQTEITTKDLVDAFRLKHADGPARKLLNQTAMEKKRIVESNDKIKAIIEVRSAGQYFSDDISEILSDSKIKTLSLKISESSPVQSTITKIDFNSPISVALFEEVSERVINLSEKKKDKVRFGNIKKKVKNMWTSESFKKDLKTMITEMASAENAKLIIEKFVKQHVEILVLEGNELDDLILKTALMIGESAKADGIVELFKEFCSLDETKELKSEYVARNNIVEDDAKDAMKPDAESDTEVKPDEKKPAEKNKETAIDEDSINKVLKVLNKIADSLKEKTMESRYVKSFVTALEDAKVGSIGEGKLKEILDFLNSVYESANTEKDDEESGD